MECNTAERLRALRRHRHSVVWFGPFAEARALNILPLLHIHGLAAGILVLAGLSE